MVGIRDFVLISDQKMLNFAKFSAEQIRNNSKRQIRVFLIFAQQSESRDVPEDFSNFDQVIEVFLDGSFTKSRHVSGATYLKCYLDQLIPSNVNEIIYLDCDLLIGASINQLMEFDLSNSPLAAAIDFGHRRTKEILNTTNLTFNAGVLVINLDLWRKESIHAKSRTLILENNLLQDQFVLNSLFANRWALLPNHFNESIFINDSRLGSNTSIFHFVGPFKPWNSHCGDKGESWRELYLRWQHGDSSRIQISKTAYGIFLVWKRISWLNVFVPQEIRAKILYLLSLIR